MSAQPLTTYELTFKFIMFFRAWVIHAKKRDGPGSFYMEIEIEIWMCRDERHVSAFRQLDRKS